MSTKTDKLKDRPVFYEVTQAAIQPEVNQPPSEIYTVNLNPVSNQGVVTQADARPSRHVPGLLHEVDVPLIQEQGDVPIPDASINFTIDGDTISMIPDILGETIGIVAFLFRKIRKRGAA